MNACALWLRYFPTRSLPSLTNDRSPPLFIYRPQTHTHIDPLKANDRCPAYKLFFAQKLHILSVYITLNNIRYELLQSLLRIPSIPRLQLTLSAHLRAVLNFSKRNQMQSQNICIYRLHHFLYNNNAHHFIIINKYYNPI